MISPDSIIKNKRVISFLIKEKDFLNFVKNHDPLDYYAFDKSYEKDYESKNHLCLAKYYNYKQAKKNNAEVLFLNSTAAAAIRRYYFIGHVKYFLLPINISLLLIPVLMGLLRYATRKQYKYLWILKTDSKKIKYRYWLVFETNRKKASLCSARFYSPIISRDILFKKLEDINYCLLRWHEWLDTFTKDDDLDMLVANGDIDRVIDILNTNIGTLPMGLHPVSGHHLLGKSKISYYPPELAEEILMNSIVGPNNVKIPNPEYALLCFIYHALFRKGYKSGLKSKFNKSVSKDKFSKYLNIKAQDAGISVPNTMEELAEFLKYKNWLPTKDMIYKYALSNEWVKDYFLSDNAKKFPPGLTVFLIRELGSKTEIIDETKHLLKEAGFKILKSEKLCDVKQSVAAKKIRGGNWKESKVSEASGLPSWVITAFDPNPIKPNKKKLISDPFLDNARIMIKTNIRKMANEHFLQNQKVNIIHSSDNSHEALDYIEVLLSDNEKKYYLDYLLSHTK